MYLFVTEFRHLFRFNTRLALGALGIVVLVRLLLLVVPFRSLNRVFGNRENSLNPPKPVDRSRRLRIARAVAIASQLVPGASCLTQAFAAKFLLRLRGDDANLLMGATRKADGRFEAHAWLEKDGEVIVGNLPELSNYVRFAPGAGSL